MKKRSENLFLTALGMLVLSSGLVGTMKSAYGATGAGNGGDAVVCYTGTDRQTITSVQSFDYWEQDAVLHVPGGVDLGATNIAVKQKLDIELARFDQQDTYRTQQVRQIAYAINDHINDYLVTSAQLPDIDDANPRLIPNSPCYIEQFAVQWQDVSTGIRRFAISAKFYLDPHTDNNARAGIIMHEAIYRTAILAGSTNSDGSRYLNYLFATHYFDQAHLNEYANALAAGHLVKPECHFETIGNTGVMVFTDGQNLCAPYKTYAPNLILEASTAPGSSYVDYSQGIDHVQFYAGALSSVSVLVNGHFQKVSLPQGIVFGAKDSRAEYVFGYQTAPLTLKFQNKSLQCKGNAWLFADGGVSGCDFSPSASFVFSGGSRLVDSLKTDAQNHVIGADLINTSVLPIHGSSQLATTSGTVGFDTNGALIDADATNEIAVIANGFPEKIHRFTINVDSGLASIQVYHPVLPPSYQGKRVIADADAFCAKLGYQGAPAYIEDKSESIFISGSEIVFDPRSNSFVNKEDENVELLTILSCAGAFEVKIP